MATTESNGTERRRAGEDSETDLAVIREQTRETLELLRSLVALMLPKQQDGEGPKFEDLIAALIAQQRDILVGVRQILADIAALFDRLNDAPPARPNGGR